MSAQITHAPLLVRDQVITMGTEQTKTQPAFAEIDFEEIEFRSEYRYTIDVFVANGLMLNFLIGIVFELLSTSPDFHKIKIKLLLAICSALFTIWRYFRFRSHLILTAHGVRLKRPAPFKESSDVEIPYTELADIKIIQHVTEPLFQKQVKLTYSAMLTSKDGEKCIEVDKRLPNFKTFIEELKRRRQLAHKRYQSYAQGTAQRQPERAKTVQHTIKEIQYEQLQEAKASAERLQKILRPQPALKPEEKQPHA